MKNWHKKSFSFLIINCLALFSWVIYPTDLGQIQAELANNKKVINQKKIQEKNILKQLGNLRKDIYLTQKKLNNAYEKYNAYQDEIKDIENKLKNEKESYIANQKYIKARIISLYKEPNTPIIEFIFNSDSFSEMLNNMYYYEKLIENDFKELQVAKELISRYNNYLQKIEKNKSAANDLKNNILKERYSLKKTKSRYQNNLTSLRTELKAFEERNRVLIEESSQLSKFINDSSKDSREYYGTGTYIRPAGGYISSRFGLRRHPIFKKRRMHNGMDFAAPRGYRIKATDSGYVIFSGMKKGYGNVTIINHGWKNGKEISSLYAHQWRMITQKGQFVEKGQLIGYVGSTGYSTGPHLHFEIRENGKPVNPSQYLRI